MDYALAPAGIELLDRDLLGLGGDRRAHVVADRGLEELVEVQPPGPVEAGRHVRQDVEDDLDVGGHGQAGAVGEGDLLVLRAPLVGLLGIGVGALDRRVFDDPLADADEVPARAEGDRVHPRIVPQGADEHADIARLDRDAVGGDASGGEDERSDHERRIGDVALGDHVSPLRFGRLWRA